MSKKDEKDSLTSEFVLDHFKDDKAVLISGDKECVIPASFLPTKLRETDIIQVTFSTDEHEKKRREMNAKEILNEILKG